MAVVIRLARGGTKKKPFYHVVATDKESPRDGKYLARLGLYDPKVKDESKRLTLNGNMVEKWIAKGAKVSETVGHLIRDHKKANKQ